MSECESRDGTKKKRNSKPMHGEPFCAFLCFWLFACVGSCCCYKTSAVSLFQVFMAAKKNVFLLQKQKDFMNFYRFFEFSISLLLLKSIKAFSFGGKKYVKMILIKNALLSVAIALASSWWRGKSL